jgi:DNA mismatch endonuclease (patch repair protein)
MVDTFPTLKRKQIMAAVKSKNTRPEMIVRRMVHGMGFRFRLHVKSLPGTPDLVFAKRKKVIQVHGCFWHGHAGCSRSTLPTTNASFWSDKISANKKRDRKAERDLTALGFRSLTIWQCELRETSRVVKKLAKFLGAPGRAAKT